MGNKYGDALRASQNLMDFVDDIKQFLLILKQGVVDYYGLASFGENSINLLIAN